MKVIRVSGLKGAGAETSAPTLLPAVSTSCIIWADFAFALIRLCHDDENGGADLLRRGRRALRVARQRLVTALLTALGNDCLLKP